MNLSHFKKFPKDSAQFNDALNQRQILERSIRDNSRERYQFHQARLERDKRERDELLKSRTIALKEKMAKDKAQKEKIQAAMQRIKKSKNRMQLSDFDFDLPTVTDCSISKLQEN